MAQSLPITDSTFSCNSMAASKASLYWPASKRIHIKYVEKLNTVTVTSNENKIFLGENKRGKRWYGTAEKISSNQIKT